MAAHPMRREEDRPPARAKRARIYGAAAVIGVLLILAGGVIGQRTNKAATRAEAATKVLRELETNECDRVQRLRDDVNDLAAALHYSLVQASDAQDRLAQMAPPLIRRLQADLAADYRRRGRAAKFAPAVDCAAAALDPAYREPPRRPFTGGH